MKAVILTKGKIATVDDEDFDRVSQTKWHAVKKGRAYYAAHRITTSFKKSKIEYLHQFILGGIPCDHIGGDGLDNRKEKLRPATKLQNNRAFRRKSAGKTSKFRGVCWDADREKWRASLQVSDVKKYLGLFVTEESAARAYDKAAREHFGEFAAPNFSL